MQATSTPRLKRQPCHVHQIVVEAAIEDQAEHGLGPCKLSDGSSRVSKNKPCPIKFLCMANIYLHERFIFVIHGIYIYKYVILCV